MPSQTVTLSDEQYRYVIDTTPDGQSTSARIRELVDQGIEHERGEGEVDV